MEFIDRFSTLRHDHLGPARFSQMSGWSLLARITSLHTGNQRLYAYLFGMCQYLVQLGPLRQVLPVRQHPDGRVVVHQQREFAGNEGGVLGLAGLDHGRDYKWEDYQQHGIILIQTGMDHPKVTEVMSEIIKSNSVEAEKIEPTINIKLQSAVQNCFSRSGDNPDRFANCMLDTQKKITEVTEAFQFKNLFLANYVQKCLQSNDVPKCTKEGSALFKAITSTLLSQVEKI